MKYKLRVKMIVVLSIIMALVVIVFVFLHQAKFGRIPGGERKERILTSPNYYDGKFQNQNYTPQFTGDKGVFALMSDLFFGKYERLKPIDEIPFVKTDLQNLDSEQNILVWFGHSSYFIQIDGKRILVDPVLSDAASPVFFVNKPFYGSNFYQAEDIPSVDYLIITHDHWDHLDYPTVMSLKDRISKIICSLGVGEHFERWKFKKSKIIEMDWNDSITLADGFSYSCLPARHFSGRGLSPNQSLWASFLLQTPTMKIYIGGDSGYDKHFAEIGKQFGTIDLAILENGQYNAEWRYIHMMPEDVVQAAKDLNTVALLPVHSSKFSLAKHPWDEPLRKVTQLTREERFRTLTPKIGEVVHLKDSAQQFTEWWVDLN